ncbi:hypothetical protein TL16_g03036 [Triparma laevis f. inornata]|uniref:Uncharacterized protein n=1 Tax=Triparma laevis f. inornata TaxID=1714386 RepID=A0A9W7A054_9STRA|nr:hypothetical protein TL16_g03036 [Triparma laevis f. inornata]
MKKLELRAELSDRSVKFEKKDNKSVLIELLRQRLLYENGVLGGNNFLNTDDYRRLLVPFLPNDTLMTTTLVSKPWSRVADGFISDSVESSVMIVHGGKDISWEVSVTRRERRKLATRVIFLLNITKVENYACDYAVNLVVVDIPEGVESIGQDAFRFCASLTTVPFPMTLTLIDLGAFKRCSSLDNADLLHTNLQELGDFAFFECSELKSMKIPDSLQTLGYMVFNKCSKLVPSNINTENTFAVVAHLRSLQN